MPRIRTIKPEYWSDEKLSPLDDTTRLVFLGMISMADDAGRLLDNVKQIDAFIYPHTQRMAATAKAVETLHRLGRLQRGKTESGQAVIQITGFTTHQKIDRPNFRACLPPIAGDFVEARQRRLAKAVVAHIYAQANGLCAKCGVLCDHAKAHRHVVRVDITGGDEPENLHLLCLSCHPDTAGTANSTKPRRTLDDKSSKAHRTISVSTIYDLNHMDETRANFETAWAAYPKRPGNPKGRAWKAYQARVAGGEDPAAILAGVKAYAAYVEREAIPVKYIKHTATFFGDTKPYLDDYGEVTSPPIQLYDPVSGDMTEAAARILGRIA